MVPLDQTYYTTYIQYDNRYFAIYEDEITLSNPEIFTDNNYNQFLTASSEDLNSIYGYPIELNQMILPTIQET